MVRSTQIGFGWSADGHFEVRIDGQDPVRGIPPSEVLARLLDNKEWVREHLLEALYDAGLPGVALKVQMEATGRQRWEAYFEHRTRGARQ